jgi:16S rRNA G966 N2-methylase RsmD
MFSYYGRKSKIVKHYPPPTYSKIIECFAGSAVYSLEHFQKDVILVERYDVLVRLWEWLINEAEPRDIISLPVVNVGDDLRKFETLSEEERDLMGFCLNRGSATPKNKVGKFSDGWENTKKRIANDLYKIKHWKVLQASYEDITNQKATWFVDPPYQFGGKWYKHNTIDYRNLREFCLSREGQVIVCENTKADWIELKPLVKIQGAKNTNTIEAIWTNTIDSQTSLF